MVVEPCLLDTNKYSFRIRAAFFELGFSIDTGNQDDLQVHNEV